MKHRSTQPPITNEFKAEPRFIKEPLRISEAELAAYRYTGLKLAYQQRQVQDVVDKIQWQKERKLIRLNNIVTRSFAVAVVLAVIGLVITH